jgi:hypothetical protein
MYNNDDQMGPPDFDEDFRVEPGDMLYKPLKKGQAILLNAGTVLTEAHINKIAESGLLEEAKRCIKKAIRDPGITEGVGAQYDAEIDKAQRIRDSLKGLLAMLWLLLIASGGYTALQQFKDLFNIYLTVGIFVAIVITYLVSMSVFDNQTRLMKAKSDRIKEARRRLEERAERARAEKVEEMKHRMQQKGF